MLVVAGSATEAPATSETRIGPKNSVLFGGELRLRAEAFNGYRFDRTSALNEDDFLATRLLLNLKPAKPGSVGWFAEIASASLYASELVDTRRVPARSQDRFNITQAWLETRLGWSAWRLRAGRQMISFGDDTLLGTGNWNLRNLWDGVRLTYDAAPWKVDVFDAKGVAHDDTRLLSGNLAADLTGVYATRANTPFPGGSLDLYALKNANRTTGADTRTFGTRLYGKTPRALEYDVEFPVQTGTFGGRDQRASAVRLQAARQFEKARYKPRLGFEYRRATGDDPATAGRNETFDGLYATVHRHLGSMDYFPWVNVESRALLLRWFPHRTYDFDLNLFRFRLVEPSIGFAGRRPTAAQIARGLSDDAGTEIDFTAKYRRSKSLEYSAGLSHFRPGEFLRGAGNGRADPANWAFLQAVLKF